MTLGFYALVVAGRGAGDFKLAALRVFAAAILDGLDGRFARYAGTSSDFGRQYDSLADAMTFGMVPALLSYSWCLTTRGQIGWMVPLFFVVCAATRLARYNVQAAGADRRFFVGLPVPAAAGLVGSLLFYAPDADLAWEAELFLAVLPLLGILMVSTFRYYSFKEIDPRRRLSYRIALPIAAVLFLVMYSPAAFFLVVSGAYAASGPLLWLRSRLRRSGGPARSTLDAPQPRGSLEP